MGNLIDFQPGYYEWHVYVNGECAYVFGDLIEDVPNPLTMENLNSSVEDLIDMMKWNIDSGEWMIQPEAKNILYANLETLTDKMMQRLFYEWGVVQ